MWVTIKAGKTARLVDQPAADATAISAALLPGDKLELLELIGLFSKVRFSPAGGPQVVGFLRSSYITSEANPVRSEIDRRVFAQQCLYSARTFNVNAFYLVALAFLETDLRDLVNLQNESSGPFLLSPEAWIAYRELYKDRLADIPANGFDLAAFHPMLVACLTDDTTRSLSVILPDKRLPTAAELYVAYRLGIGAAKELLAFDYTTTVDAALAVVFESHNDVADRVNTTLDSNARFFKLAGSPATIKQALDSITGAFDAAFRLAASLIDLLPEEERLAESATMIGKASWLTAAQNEVGVLEDMEKGKTNSRISDYHKAAKPFTPDLDDVPWCGSFVSWCLNATGDKDVLASNLRSRRAADWIDWGEPVPVPTTGCVAVLEPLDSDSTGHVGFFVGGDAEYIELLAGNQRDRNLPGHPQAVCVARFPLRKVRQFRLLRIKGDSAGKTGSYKLDQAIATPSALQIQMAELIVKKFLEAGFGAEQQIAALANAIAESRLNPNAHNTSGEDSVGLFQLNRAGGQGTGFSVEQLKDPEFNIARILKKARAVTAFVLANDVSTATSVFMRSVEVAQMTKKALEERLDIARLLVSR